jgi:hypothetical protein
MNCAVTVISTHSLLEILAFVLKLAVGMGKLLNVSNTWDFNKFYISLSSDE